MTDPKPNPDETLTPPEIDPEDNLAGDDEIDEDTEDAVDPLEVEDGN